MATVYLGIGSNIGDKKKNLEKALHLLKGSPDITFLQASGFYITPPAGGPPQEDYVNGVLKIETGVPPEKLLEILKEIEKSMGRMPAGKDHPRVIDLDILTYGKLVIDTDKLVIPHPRMHERYFVLKPLSEIAPDLVHPLLDKTMDELCRNNVPGDRRE